MITFLLLPPVFFPRPTPRPTSPAGTSRAQEAASYPTLSYPVVLMLAGRHPLEPLERPLLPMWRVGPKELTNSPPCLLRQVFFDQDPSSAASLLCPPPARNPDRNETRRMEEMKGKPPHRCCSVTKRNRLTRKILCPPRPSCRGDGCPPDANMVRRLQI